MAITAPTVAFASPRDRLDAAIAELKAAAEAHDPTIQKWEVIISSESSPRGAAPVILIGLSPP